MHLPSFCRGAAIVGIVLLVSASESTRSSAGVVAPSDVDLSPAIAIEATPVQLSAVHVAVASLPAPSHPQSFWFPGSEAAGSALGSVPIPAVDANVDIPGTGQTPLIPLPGAAWTGMAGLLGLGAVKLLRNARRFLS